MHLKSNSRGVTLVELLIAVSLLTIVLFSAYLFLSFSYKSLNNTETAYDAGQNARISIMKMEESIRKAKKVKIGGVAYKAVNINATGTQIDIYTNVDADSEMELVQYKLENDAIVMRAREINAVTPTAWTTVVTKVKNNMLVPATPVFYIDGYKVSIKLLVLDDTAQLMDDPVIVEASFTVRSKGVMD